MCIVLWPLVTFSCNRPGREGTLGLASPLPEPLGHTVVIAVEEGELSWPLLGQQIPYLGRRQAEDF